MLFGMALLYSTSGTTYLTDMARVLPGIINQPGVIIGLLFTLGGFFFKLAVFPFHFWAPDTYQGAANQVAAYIATASKVAAIAVILRVVAFAGQGSAYLVHCLVILSVVSMTLGNLAAIVQKDLKRLLAFSTIAHSGYVLIGILVLSPAGYSGAIFYALALLVMKFTAFMVVVELASDGRNLQIEELAGLHKRSPILALALMVSLFSLAGIPPTIGFTGKFLVFVAAIEKGYIALVIIAMINVVISLYYYLLVIKAAYLLEPAEALPPLSVSFAEEAACGDIRGCDCGRGFFPLLACSTRADRRPGPGMGPINRERLTTPSFRMLYGVAFKMITRRREGGDAGVHLSTSRRRRRSQHRERLNATSYYSVKRGRWSRTGRCC